MPHPSTGGLVGVGLLGSVATVGILLYELRNMETLAAAPYHARDLARMLGLHVFHGRAEPAGVIRPSGRHHQLFGTVTVGQDQALGLVYGAALGGWTYLLAWGVLRGLHVSGARDWWRDRSMLRGRGRVRGGAHESGGEKSSGRHRG